MLGRIPGITCAHRNLDTLGHNPQLRTPGPTGINDAVDPNVPGAVGDTPGPLGHADYAEKLAGEYPRWLANRRPELPPPREQPEMDLGKLYEQLRVHHGKGQTTVHADVQKAIDAAKLLIRTFDELPEEKKRIVVDMVFTLGKTGFGDLKELIQAIEAKDFDKAAREMQNSIWFVQVGRRGQELVALMKQKPPEPEPEPPAWHHVLKRDAPTPAIITPVRPRHGFGAIDV